MVVPGLNLHDKVILLGFGGSGGEWTLLRLNHWVLEGKYHELFAEIVEEKLYPVCTIHNQKQISIERVS